MQEVGESLTTVGCSASIISRSRWFWGNFNIGKIIHPAKDLTMEAGAMDEVSVSHHWAMKFRESRLNCILQIYAVLLHECRAAGLRHLGWKAPQCYQRFYFQENALTAFWNLMRWTMQGGRDWFLTASFRGSKGKKWESFFLGNPSWTRDTLE